MATARPAVMILLGCTGVGGALLYLTTGSSYDLDPGRHGHANVPNTSADVSQRAVASMLHGLEGKTLAQKLEAVHDGATQTHEIGFGTDESSVRNKGK